MKRSIRNRSSGRRDTGYALLMIVFFAALVLITATMVTPKIRTQGRRQMEEELEWRGNQYKRGIRLYYRKTGRFPQSMEDLTKPKMGSLRFMRQAYKDPMNPDGSWRLIYVGPGGQLIGSLKRKASSASGVGLGQNVAGSPRDLTGAGSAPDTESRSGPGSSPPSCGSPEDASVPGAGGTLIGGNIIGVGSKVNRASIKVLEDATNYCEWEFIWDPSKDAQGAGQPGAPVGAPIGSPVGSPLNPSPGAPSSGLPGAGQPPGSPPQANPPPYGQQPQN